MDDNPIIIKPPAIVRQNFLRRRLNDELPSAPSMPEKRTVPAKKDPVFRKIYNRNSKDPIGTKEKINLKKNKTKGMDWDPAKDDAFYRSLRTLGLEPSPMNDDTFYRSLRKLGLKKREIEQPSKPELYDDTGAKLEDVEDGARERKSVFQEWKKKIASLESNLKDQDSAMREVLKQNEALEEKVATFDRKEMLFQRAGGHQSAQEVLKEKLALATETERRKSDNVQTLGQKNVEEERKKLRIKEKQLEKALSIAREENDKLLKQVSKMDGDMGNHLYSEGQALLEQNKLKRKEVELERSLAVAQKENGELVTEIRSRNLEFEKLERQRLDQEEKIETLRSELEVNRRIVHTKRSLIRKELLDEDNEKMRKEITEQLTVELTARITGDLECILRAEKERDLREMRAEDEERVRVAENQIPVLESEIDRLRRDLSNAKTEHERAIASIEDKVKKKIDIMVTNFSNDREREELDFIKRVEALSNENERTKERAAKEKEELGSRVREEVTAEMQKEIQFLADEVTELTKGSIDVVEVMTKEKELYGDKIREQMIKERDELLEEAAKEKELFAESIRQEKDLEHDKETSNLKNELRKIIRERESLVEKIAADNSHQKRSDQLQQELEKFIRRVEDVERERDSLRRSMEESEIDARLTKENHAKDIKKLEELWSQLESSKNEIVKLKKEKRELIVIADEFKNDCADMANEVKRIKGHFKFSVLVEYEEKIMQLENEIKRLETIIGEAKEFNSEDVRKISEQTSKLDQYKAKEQTQNTMVNRLSKELMSSLSELEMKETRLVELKEIIRKKENEVVKLNECVRDLRRSLGGRENELAKVRSEQEISNQKIISNDLYKDKLTSLNEELAEHKSRLQHCRCAGMPFGEEDFGEPINSEHLRERIQRLSVLLQASEKNQHEQNLSFEVTKERLDKNLLACKEEIKGLHSEVSRLKNLLSRSQKDLMESLEREAFNVQLVQDLKTPRIKNNQTKIGQLQQKQILHKIETAEQIVYDTNLHRSDSEKMILNLKDELSLRDEEKRTLEQELLDSKVQFREALTSLRDETRSFKNQLDQSRKPESTELSFSALISKHRAYFDSESESMDDASEPPKRSLEEIIAEYGDSEQRSDIDIESLSKDESSKSQHQSASSTPLCNSDSRPSSVQVCEIDVQSLSKDRSSKSQHQSASPKTHSIEEQNDSEIRDDLVEQNNHTALNPNPADTDGAEIRDDEFKAKGKQQGKKANPHEFSKMLNITEHTTSIEMIYDPQNGEQLDDNASAIYHSLQEFKNEYKQYLENNYFTDVLGNPVAGKPTEVQWSNDKTTKFTHAPQPHSDNSNDEEDRIIRQSSMSTISRGSLSEIDTRDDNVEQISKGQRISRETSFPQARDSSLSQHTNLSTNESEDNCTKNTSENSSLSERSRILRKKMSDLLEIKNSIKRRTSLSITTDTDTAIVAKEQEEEQEQEQQQQGEMTRNPGAPWGSAAQDHPKLYKFLKSKDSSDSGDITTTRSDEHLKRKHVRRLDGNSKHSWRE